MVSEDSVHDPGCDCVETKVTALLVVGEIPVDIPTFKLILIPLGLSP
jgi:hypothetical protein